MHESRGVGGSSAMLCKELRGEFEEGDEGRCDVVRLELVDDPSNDCRVRFCRKVLLDLTNLDPGVDIALAREKSAKLERNCERNRLKTHRSPFTFTWPSLRPRHSMFPSPSANHLPRSPVLYRRRSSLLSLSIPRSAAS